MTRFLFALSLALAACSPTGLVVRAEGAIRAHEQCAELGGSWEQSYSEQGPARTAQGISGGVLVTYECRFSP